MPPHICELCKTARAQILRPKNHARICAPCFLSIFENEVAATITSNRLFQPGERVAIGASGGKDSTVLASVLKTLNCRYSWGLDLVLLSIDEGITGYRDHSLEAVKRNSAELGLPLKIVSYEELYGWSMDEVVKQVGKKGNCTYCGVFRRQALDRGAAMLGVGHVVTGHNADDVAETVLMNLLRGDLPRLSRATSIVTSTPSASFSKNGPSNGDAQSPFTNVKRSKPLMYAYEKEIVLYAHHKKLDYFSTECIYSPEAFRGSARTLIKNLERIRPESILDVVKSGIEMANLVPGSDGYCRGASGGEVASDEMVLLEADDIEGGCGSGNGQDSGGEMARMEQNLLLDQRAEENGTETEIRLPTSSPAQRRQFKCDRHSNATFNGEMYDQDNNETKHLPLPVQKFARNSTITIRPKQGSDPGRKRMRDVQPAKQKLGQCERCGYLSSQTVCKACVLLEGLNKSRPKTGIEVVGEG